MLPKVKLTTEDKVVSWRSELYIPLGARISAQYSKAPSCDNALV